MTNIYLVLGRMDIVSITDVYFKVNSIYFDIRNPCLYDIKFRFIASFFVYNTK